jgi:hypothetical protein
MSSLSLLMSTTSRMGLPLGRITSPAPGAVRVTIGKTGLAEEYVGIGVLVSVFYLPSLFSLILFLFSRWLSGPLYINRSHGYDQSKGGCYSSHDRL